MAYTAVKFADVQKAIAAVKLAQSNYDTAIKNTSSTSAVNTKSRINGLRRNRSLPGEAEATCDFAMNHAVAAEAAFSEIGRAHV